MRLFYYIKLGVVFPICNSTPLVPLREVRVVAKDNRRILKNSGEEDLVKEGRAGEKPEFNYFVPSLT